MADTSSFFNRVHHYFQQQGSLSRIDQYVQSWISPPLEQRRRLYYRCFLAVILKNSTVPHNANSPQQELRWLYQLVEHLDPYYFTKSHLEPFFRKNTNLALGHQEFLKHQISQFFTFIRIIESEDASMVYDKNCISQWLSLFPKEQQWEALVSLQHTGFAVGASQAGHRAWVRFTHGTDASENQGAFEWLSLCQEHAETEQHSLFYVDQLADAFAAELSLIEIKTFCHEIPNCIECPLRSECAYPNSLPQNSDPVWISFRKAQGETISTEKILYFLLNPLSENHLLSSVPRLIHLRELQQKTRMDLQTTFPTIPHVAEKLMGLFELFRRYQESELSPGKSFASSADIFHHFRFTLETVKQELFLVVLLDHHNHYLHETMITKGLLNKSLVHPREVFSVAIEHRAAAIILIHNHPSGDPQPSDEDIQITQRIKNSGKIIGIEVLDHIIIGNRVYYSFADEGRL